jgi:aryl-alcohol dehydrogenase-like predicted oxidoreductase
VVLDPNAESGMDSGTHAYVDSTSAQPTTVRAGGNLTITASDTANKIELYAGAVAFGTSSGVGVSSVVLVRPSRVDAAIHSSKDVPTQVAGGLTLVPVERLDLVQLHCPPDGVYESDAVFETLDEMVDSGSIAAYGISVETCAQALSAIARPGVATVQIILNCFRLKPLEEVLPAAREAGVGIIVRVPLASGLLTGRYDENTKFGAEDHRNYNRRGEMFDVGETFSGVPYEVGVAAARELGELVEPGTSLAQFALRWVIDQAGVSTVIPGARNAEQATRNAASAEQAPLRADQLQGVRDVYDRLIREHVHARW